MANRVDGDLTVTGSLSVNGTFTGSVPRTSLTQDTAKQFAFPLTRFRVWDAFGTSLGSASADDLGIAGGTWATGVPHLITSDAKATTVTQRARCMIQLPQEYVAAGNCSIVVHGGMKTTVSDTTATVDVEAFLCGTGASGSLVSGSDLVTTSATTINSLTFADKEFVLTATALTPGAYLDVRITIAITDGATGTAVYGAIANAALSLNVRG